MTLFLLTNLGFAGGSSGVAAGASVAGRPIQVGRIELITVTSSPTVGGISV